MHNYLWNKEKDLGIRKALKPMEGQPLSGVVLVVEGGVGYCYIKFTEDTVKKLGMKMPKGIGQAHPAYLKIINKGTYYDVVCSYFDKSHTIFLWKSESLPEWVYHIRYKN